ncbi:MAG: hypothetical protein ACOYYS_10795 [Chloroflexota bacterium]
MLDLLATGGVMRASQLGLADRTLRKYAHGRLIDRLPCITRQLSQALGALGLPGDDESLYTLGPVGSEIAKQRHGHPPPGGYLGFTLQRTLHDLLCNEIVLRLSAFAEGLGWSVGWVNGQGAALHKDGEAILEPGALLKLQKGGQGKCFLLEYHDEDKAMRAGEKVRRYEAAFRSNIWPGQWETDAFPAVLAVFRSEIVGRGYLDAIREREQVRVTYYGKRLDGVLAKNLAEWRNVASGQREALLGEGR